MPDESIFLLTEKQRAYFQRIKAEIFKGLHAEKVDTTGNFTVQDETLQKVAQSLTIKPAAAYKKAHKAATELSFSLMWADVKSKPLLEYLSEFPGTSWEKIKESKQFFFAPPNPQSEIYNPESPQFEHIRVIYRECFFLLNEQRSFLKTPYLHDVNPGTAAYEIMTEGDPLSDETELIDQGNGKYRMNVLKRSIREITPEMLEQLRDALGLAGYRYIGTTDHADILFLDSFLNAAVAALPSVEMTASGKPPVGKEDTPKRFSYIRQGPGLNEYIKLQPYTGDGETGNVDLDDTTGIATISKPGYSIQIPYALLPGLRASAYQLLDAFVRRYTENGSRNPAVSLTLDDYMTARGLTDRKKAKEQAVADMKVLRFSSVAWEEKHGKKTVSFEFMNLADRGKISRDGIMSFTFGATFHSILSEYPLMPYPDFLLRINSKNNPNSYFFGRKIAEHKRMNAGKPNADTISVETLLSVARSIPSYEKVMQGNRNITARIIEPFERDMDALAPDITWEYCKKSNSPLSEEELSGMNYTLFSSLLVHFTLNEYPDQSKLIEKRAAALEAAKQPAKKRKK